MSKERVPGSHLSWWRLDCLADDAVSCELVSAPNSLLTGKLTGNFAESEPSATILTFNQRANSKACRQIPYTTEQANFAGITGNFFGITGNLIERAGKALSCCRTSN